MPQTINTNTISLNAQRNLNSSQGSLAISMQRLSSGLRVNSAKDDAAGMAIAERMNAQVRGMNVAIRNANDAISLAQTAEGALGKIADNLQRMRELAVQSRNATNSAGDRTNLQKEFLQLQKEVARTINGTSFNTKNLFDGSAESNLTFQVGPGTSDADHIPIKSVNMKTTVDGDPTALATADNTIGATATPTALPTDGTATAVVMQTVISEPGTSPYAGTASTGVAIGDFDSAATVDEVNESIDRVINVLDLGLTEINNSRATYGAAQNRFEAVISNLQINSENQAAARGRIMDADFAMETANLSRAQILQQAGTAMVSQANQLPQQVLNLLKG